MQEKSPNYLKSHYNYISINAQLLIFKRCSNTMSLQFQKYEHNLQNKIYNIADRNECILLIFLQNVTNQLHNCNLIQVNNVIM